MKIIWALDFGHREVTVAAARKAADGAWSVLGLGRSAAQGLDHGDFLHIGDVAESVVAALRAAERSSGGKCSKLYYNIDDSAMASFSSKGSITLSGEGQIRGEDVRLASSSALRAVSHFDRTVVYAKETGFLIDEKDPVLDPIGIFGRHLEVTLFVLAARAQHIEAWDRAIQRAGIPSSVPVLSALSSRMGLMENSPNEGRYWICDLGLDVVSAAYFENSRIRAYASCSHKNLNEDQIGNWLKQQVSDGELVCLTGDMVEQEEMFEFFQKRVGGDVRRGAPQALPQLQSPKYAALTGLLRVASENPSESRVRGISSGTLFSDIKQKAESFIGEYF